MAGRGTGSLDRRIASAADGVSHETMHQAPGYGAEGVQHQGGNVRAGGLLSIELVLQGDS
jgi:hypothetical protein